MSDTASTQLESIRAMMASGHRSVRMERHTLLLWGIAAAFLILVVDAIFTRERFPEVWARALSANAFIAAVLTAAGIWDFRLTRRARQRRDETLSFVQLQVTKVWWLLLGLVVLINLGMNFFGGGYLFYGVVLALVGLALYIHGLFSQQMLAWVGLLTMAMGMASVALYLPFALMEWLATFAFGLGFPFLGFALNAMPSEATVGRRAAVLAGWLAIVLVPTAVVYQWDRHTAAPNVAAVALNSFMQEGGADTGQHVVELPAGTSIPVRLRITGDVLKGPEEVTVPITLASPVELVIQDGIPEGRYRVGAGDWRHRMYNVSVFARDFKTTLTRKDGPQIHVDVDLKTNN
jgi:hypothetical protein